MFQFWKNRESVSNLLDYVWIDNASALRTSTFHFDLLKKTDGQREVIHTAASAESGNNNFWAGNNVKIAKFRECFNGNLFGLA